MRGRDDDVTIILQSFLLSHSDRKKNSQNQTKQMRMKERKCDRGRLDNNILQ